MWQSGQRVRTLARYCNFQSELDIMLRDRFILGLQDVRERERLFTEDAGKITFVAAMELVQSVQCARAAARRAAAGDSGGASSVGGVFALKTATGGQGAPLESASSGGRRRAVDVRGAPLMRKKEGHLRRMCRKKGDARASHYLAAELAGDVEGKLNKFKVQLQLKPDAKPIFFKPRPVPFALKPKVDEALDKLIETGILKSVNYSDYATPITPVLKSDGTVRVCGDYSVTLNKVLHIDRYPLPRIEELFARLHEGKEFSKLDLSMAYMQLELTEDSQPLTCINTHRGLSNLHDWFWVIVGACDISKTMERILAGIEGICFVIDKDGLHTSPGKVKAIKEAEPPKNVSQLKSFLGLVNYYRSFVPRMSTILGPLHDLLKMGAKWMWSEAHQSAFETVKRALESELALAHYDPRLSTVLTVDASPTGLGAVLAQQQEDGSESDSVRFSGAHPK
ncbi:Transposon Tf2-9 polyprotein [Eumeta japonica]|uniref:Transposon Tf2-9 polyprotein n=1 Tax=Eumeta variegata TaxID=151549 RepID=A0A4C1U118_EUMVA|nr:Transposon Tf2-9 polyprotein [Eumeta japonica]